MAKYDDVDNSRVFTIGLLGFLTTGLVVLVAQGMYDWMSCQLRENRTVEIQSSIDEINKQRKDLDSYILIDKAKKRYGVPIDKAMEETLKELKAAKTPATAAL